MSKKMTVPEIIAARRAKERKQWKRDKLATTANYQAHIWKEYGEEITAEQADTEIEGELERLGLKRSQCVETVADDVADEAAPTKATQLEMAIAHAESLLEED